MVAFVSIVLYLLWVIFPYKPQDSPSSEDLQWAVPDKLLRNDANRDFETADADSPKERPMDHAAAAAQPQKPLATHSGQYPVIEPVVQSPHVVHEPAPPPGPSGSVSAYLVMPAEDSGCLAPDPPAPTGSEKEIRIVISNYPNLPKKWVYPNDMPCPGVKCVPYHDQNPRMFSGFTDDNKARLPTMHIMQVDWSVDGALQTASWERGNVPFLTKPPPPPDEWSHIALSKW